MRPPGITRRRLILAFAGLVWAIGLPYGLARMWSYQMTPGQSATPLLRWPKESRLPISKHQMTLVMVAHPECPCTRASVEALDEILAQSEDKIKAYVLFFKPTVVPKHWGSSTLWNQARAIPGVVTLWDENGTEASLFGAKTSGQTFLFTPAGALLFSGGITPSRGHEGDSVGQSKILETLVHKGPGTEQTPVYGCSLLSPLKKKP